MMSIMNNNNNTTYNNNIITFIINNTTDDITPFQLIRFDQKKWMGFFSFDY